MSSKLSGFLSSDREFFLAQNLLGSADSLVYSQNHRLTQSTAVELWASTKVKVSPFFGPLP